jgi:hypothetical protein
LVADDREAFPGDEEHIGLHDEGTLAIQPDIDRRDRHRSEFVRLDVGGP